MYEDGLDQTIAVKLLIEGYPHDDTATASIAKLIREEEHAFSSDSHQIWRTTAAQYVGNAQIIAAADKWLTRWSSHRYPEISFAARLGWTGTAKKKLLENLNVWVPFWAAGALLDGWGMDDPEVSSALFALANSDKASDIGHLLPRIISDREECSSRLIGLLESSDCREPGHVLEGICQVLAPYDRERVLQAALPWAERRRIIGGRERVARLLFEYFADDSRVKELARAEMTRRDGVWATVVSVFGADSDIVADGVRIAAPLPAELRFEIVSFLELNALIDEECFNLLSLYDLESDPILKSKATIAFCKTVERKGPPPKLLIDDLTQALVSGGPDYEARSQAAVCGLDILGRLDLLVSTRQGRSGTSPIDVTAGGQPNDVFISYLLSNWERMQSTLGEGFKSIFFRGDVAHDLYWWSHVVDFVDKYPALTDMLLSFLGEVRNTQVYSELLFFLARKRPRSHLLLDHCLAIIRGEGQSTGRWIEVDTAALLLGRDFGGDSDVLRSLVADASRWWMLLNPA